MLVTGGCGFVGVHLVDQLLRMRHITSITVLDSCRHTAAPQALSTSQRVRFVQGTVLDAALLTHLATDCEAVVHLAAETFVDASIVDDELFVETNITGTAVLLRTLRALGGRRLLNVSTDEVFGEASDEPFTESTPYRPRNPYAATKAAADHLVRAYVVTHGLDAVICHCSNLYGRWQYPEKLIPVTVTRLLRGEPARIYGTGQQSRTWLHVTDAAAGLVAALGKGVGGESYIIGGDHELTTLDVVGRIADQLEVPAAEAVSFVTDRPGHDYRYTTNNTKAHRELEWAPATDFETGLKDTVDWMIDHPGWWKR
ncbi:dTDP-glucose 4,6-dehydratase [Nocardia suismassiliense]|uniref:dTDP-glucose 4,6-dehydratase n=1 Tax=Nocardia suismassiliense TaxID=2077092 RepID=A0ABW6QYT1_9NOCA